MLSIPVLLAENGLHIDLFYNNYPQVTSFFENRNPYAVVSVGVFFLSLANLRNSWILSSLGLITSVYSLDLSLSRNGIFTLVLCLLFLLILTSKQIRKNRTAFILVLAAVIVVGIGYHSLHSVTINRTNATINRLLNVKTYKDLERLDLRFTFYKSALKFGLEKLPILGSGSKTFGLEVISKSEDMKSYNNSYYKEHHFFHSHNALLTIWIEMGWVGLIAVLLFLWLWFRPALRGPPLFMMPMLAVCVGQILDYFVWEIFFMAFQSFFFAHFAATITFQEMGQSSS
jgi:O-antigen ligase